MQCCTTVKSKLYYISLSEFVDAFSGSMLLLFGPCYNGSVRLKYWFTMQHVQEATRHICCNGGYVLEETVIILYKKNQNALKTVIIGT